MPNAPMKGAFRLARADRRPQLVTVFGAGVAGLTTAHELVERGFAVQVVERNGRPVDTQHAEVDVGGMARSQRCQVSVNARTTLPIAYPDDAIAEAYLAQVRRGEILDVDMRQREPLRRKDADLLRTLLARPFHDTRPLRPIAGTIRYHDFDLRTNNGFERILERWTTRDDGELDLNEVASSSAEIADAIPGWPDIRDRVVPAMHAAIVEAHAEGEKAVKSLRLDAEAWSSDEVRALIERRLTLLVEIHVQIDRWQPDVAKLIALALRHGILEHDQKRHPRINDLEEILVILGPLSGFSALPEKEAGGLDEPGFGTDRSDVISLQPAGASIYCEHGYRFFPSSHRHVFDTMRRTPILQNGLESYRSTFDHLVPTPSVDLALYDGDDPHQIPRKVAHSIEELRTSLEVLMKGLGLSGRDMLRWDIRMLKFMTSCAARREEYENESWWSFVGGADTNGYSKKASRYIARTPHALLGIPAEHIDARTHAVVATQLLLDHTPPAAGTDMTLTGPTSRAWLQPWKAYLKRQGVRFFAGTLESLRWDAESQEVRPVVTGPSGYRWPLAEDGHPYFTYEGDDCIGVSARCDTSWSPSFYVLALDYMPAARLIDALYGPTTGGAPLPDGDLGTFWCFDANAGRPRRTYRPCQPPPDEACSEFVAARADGFRAEPDEPRRPEQSDSHPASCSEDCDETPINPLRDLSGVQYFFLNHVRIGKGHVYYPDAPWGLSSISQLHYYRNRPIPGEDFLGQVSVDIGNWYTKGPRIDPPGGGGPRDGKTAWCSTRDEIEESVWQQVLAGLHSLYRANIERPPIAHLDHALELDAEGRIVANHMPYLAPLPCQWRLRPGLRRKPDRPHAPFHRTGEGHEPGSAAVSQSTDIFYNVSHKRWFMAGTHMATYTRVTTTESANESGRHVVRAILHALPVEQRTLEEEADVKQIRDPNSRCHFPALSLGGEMPDIWNPEDHELPDLEPLKRLDELLYEDNLPHFLDVLGVIDETDRAAASAAVSARAKQVGARDWEFATGVFEALMPQAPSGDPAGRDVDRLRRMLEEITRDAIKRGSP